MVLDNFDIKPIVRLPGAYKELAIGSVHVPVRVAGPIAIDGAFDGFLAQPAVTKRALVLLLPEMFGLTGAMCQAAAAFAGHGYRTLVPNLFWRSEHPAVLAYEGPERQRAWERLQTFDLAAAVDDIERAAGFLEQDGPAGSPVIAVGHCIGGRLAMLALPRTRLAGSVSYYGLGISHQGAELADLAKPAALHYGLADEHVPAREVDAVQAALCGNAKIAIYLYAHAGHSFCNPNRPMFDPDAAALVMRRTLAFIEAVDAATPVVSSQTRKSPL